MIVISDRDCAYEITATKPDGFSGKYIVSAKSLSIAMDVVAKLIGGNRLEIRFASIVAPRTTLIIADETKEES